MVSCFLVADIQNLNSSDTLESTITPTETLVNSNNFKVIYQGFIMVDVNKINDYAMPDNYIITNKDDWEAFNSKYTSGYPTSLDEIGMNWDNECLALWCR